MKHLMLLIIVLLLGYFGWRYASPLVRRHVNKFIGRHILPVVVIMLCVLALLFAMFHGGSINLF
jgi:TRAP-type C4-dicarboxylate transport system permease small subunit